MEKCSCSSTECASLLIPTSDGCIDLSLPVLLVLRIVTTNTVYLFQLCYIRLRTVPYLVYVLPCALFGMKELSTP